MIERFVRRMAPLAALAIGTALGGCDGGISVNASDGVPLAELDMAGAAPGSLVLASGDDVVIIEGSELGISVDGDSEEVESLRFILEDERLAITREDGWGSKSAVTVNVTMPPPGELIVAGSGSIRAARLASDAEVTVAGSGRIDFGTIEAETLELTVAGSGSITGAGRANSLEITIGGSGDVDLAALKADEAEISIGGSGDVALASDGNVTADIAGSGDVRVTGSAKCEVNAVGSGKLTCTPAQPASAAAASDETAGDDPAEGADAEG